MMRSSQVSFSFLLIPAFICLAGLSAAFTGNAFTSDDNDRSSPINSENALIDTPVSLDNAIQTSHLRTDVYVFHPRPVVIGDASGYTPPDFSNIKDTRTKKQAFYDYLLPKIHLANQEVMLERKWIAALLENLDQGLYPTDQELIDLERIENRYAVPGTRGSRVDHSNRTAFYQPADQIRNRLQGMLTRADIVPASLVIAQAAKESGWGSSRFAREGNNYFGIWCFTRNCGMTPIRRDNNRSHEVATFDSVEEGVRYYIRTINSHFAYTELRNMRAQARQQDRQLRGEKLATGLVSYSERGMMYVNEIRSMIQYNRLKRFSRIYSA